MTHWRFWHRDAKLTASCCSSGLSDAFWNYRFASREETSCWQSAEMLADVQSHSTERSHCHLSHLVANRLASWVDVWWLTVSLSTRRPVVLMTGRIQQCSSDCTCHANHSGHHVIRAFLQQQKGVCCRHSWEVNFHCTITLDASHEGLGGVLISDSVNAWFLRN